MNTDGCAYLDAGKRLPPARRLLLALCLGLLAPAVALSAPARVVGNGALFNSRTSGERWRRATPAARLFCRLFLDGQEG